MGKILPLRVLHILEATLGGTRRYLENIVDVSDPQVDHFGLVYSTRRCDKQFWNLLERCRAYGWELFEVPMVRSIHPWHDLRAFWQIRRIIRLFRPDIVHCHSSKAGGLGRLVVRSLGSSRPQVVYTPNALAVHLGAHFGIIERGLAPMVNLFVAISESEKREIVKTCKVSPERVAVVWPIIDPVHFAPRNKDEARRGIGLSGDIPLIVGIGRLSPQKDPMTFLKVIKCLKQELADVQAIWVGDGELRPQLEQVLEEEGLKETMWITGWQRDVRPFIAAADVILMTSRYESFGYVTAESLAMARPVVATRVTGTVDIVLDHKFGLLFGPGDWTAGATAVARLLRAPDEARAMGQAGRDFVVRFFTREAMRKNLFEAYRYAMAV